MISAWLLEFAAKLDCPVLFKHARASLTVPLEIASCLYRIAQESLNNISKYAHARNVTVKLTTRKRELALVIEDDGLGFDTTTVRGKGRLGLISMQERAALIGARFSLESNPGQGTRITVTLDWPCQPLAGSSL